MTLIELRNLIQLNQIIDKIKLDKAIRILASVDALQRDVENFKKFTIILQNEIGNNVTRETLKDYLSKENISPNIQKCCKIILSLLENSGYSTLEKYLIQYLDSLKNDEISEPYIEFTENEYLNIKLFENRFIVKSFKSSCQKEFYFKEIRSLDILEPDHGISYMWHLAVAVLSRLLGDYKLRVLTMTNEKYTFIIPRKMSYKFINFIKLVNFGILFDNLDFRNDHLNKKIASL